MQGVWGWLLPNVVPTLSLMLGVFAAASLREQVETDAMKVRSNFAKLAVALSLFHLLAVTAMICAYPFAGTLAGKPVRSMALFETSNLWLGPLQGLVAAVIGALFFSRTCKSDSQSTGNSADEQPTH